MGLVASSRSSKEVMEMLGTSSSTQYKTRAMKGVELFKTCYKVTEHLHMRSPTSRSLPFTFTFTLQVRDFKGLMIIPASSMPTHPHTLFSPNSLGKTLRKAPPPTKSKKMAPPNIELSILLSVLTNSSARPQTTKMANQESRRWIGSHPPPRFDLTQPLPARSPRVLDRNGTYGMMRGNTVGVPAGRSRESNVPASQYRWYKALGYDLLENRRQTSRQGQESNSQHPAAEILKAQETKIDQPRGRLLAPPIDKRNQNMSWNTSNGGDWESVRGSDSASQYWPGKPVKRISQAISADQGAVSAFGLGDEWSKSAYGERAIPRQGASSDSLVGEAFGTSVGPLENTGETTVSHFTSTD